MHTTASSLVAIAQYFWRIRTSVLYGNQQKFNIEAVNDYPPIRFEIRFERKFPIHRSLKIMDVKLELFNNLSLYYQDRLLTDHRWQMVMACDTLVVSDLCMPWVALMYAGRGKEVSDRVTS